MTLFFSCLFDCAVGFGFISWTRPIFLAISDLRPLEELLHFNVVAGLQKFKESRSSCIWQSIHRLKLPGYLPRILLFIKHDSYYLVSRNSHINIKKLQSDINFVSLFDWTRTLRLADHLLLRHFAVFYALRIDLRSFQVERFNNSFSVFLLAVLQGFWLSHILLQLLLL